MIKLNDRYYIRYDLRISCSGVLSAVFCISSRLPSSIAGHLLRVIKELLKPPFLWFFFTILVAFAVFSSGTFAWGRIPTVSPTSPQASNQRAVCSSVARASRRFRFCFLIFTSPDSFLACFLFVTVGARSLDVSLVSFRYSFSSRQSFSFSSVLFAFSLISGSSCAE